LYIFLCGLAALTCAFSLASGSSAQSETPAFANKVWRVAEGSSIEPGMIEVFLSDGNLLITSAHGTPLLGSWRLEGDRLLITEEGITYQADIAKLSDSEFWINIHNPGETTNIRFARVPPAAACASCPSATAQAVTGTVTYRERIALPPDAVVDLWITDVSPLIMIQSIVSETTVHANGRQVPIPFQLSYDPALIIPGHTYAINAAILANGEMLFRTDRGVHVITQHNPTHVDLVLVSALATPQP
jgi:putative lipoprotein